MSECVKVVVRCRPMNEREKCLKSKVSISHKDWKFDFEIKKKKQEADPKM